MGQGTGFTNVSSFMGMRSGPSERCPGANATLSEFLSSRGYSVLVTFHWTYVQMA